MYAHRLSYQLLVGDIPVGKCVLHKCDVPRCVRPLHLFLGTIADNNRDMVAKGRLSDRRGINGPRAILNEQQVIAIRKSYRPWKVPIRVLAERFGVSASAISSILTRRSWKHIP